MISLSAVNLRFARWVCRMIGHRPAKGQANVVPIKVICERCGDPINLVRR